MNISLVREAWEQITKTQYMYTNEHNIILILILFIPPNNLYDQSVIRLKWIKKTTATEEGSFLDPKLNVGNRGFFFLPLFQLT